MRSERLHDGTNSLIADRADYPHLLRLARLVAEHVAEDSKILSDPEHAAFETELFRREQLATAALTYCALTDGSCCTPRHAEVALYGVETVIHGELGAHTDDRRDRLRGDDDEDRDRVMVKTEDFLDFMWALRNGLLAVAREARS